MKHQITIEFEEAESSLHCGLRQSCAGCGSPFMVFSKKVGGGKERYLIMDVRKLVPLLDKALE